MLIKKNELTVADVPLDGFQPMGFLCFFFTTWNVGTRDRKVCGAKISKGCNPNPSFVKNFIKKIKILIRSPSRRFCPQVLLATRKGHNQTIPCSFAYKDFFGSYEGRLFCSMYREMCGLACLRRYFLGVRVWVLRVAGG